MAEKTNGSNGVISLPCGKGSVKLQIPEKSRQMAGINYPQELCEPNAAFEDAVAAPVGFTSLANLVEDKKVCLILADATRSEPHHAYVDACLPRFTGAKSVTAVIATGSHELESSGNLEIIEGFRKAAAKMEIPAEISIHDCHSPDLVNLGRTTRSTIVAANPDALSCDVFVVASDMKNHYFAGYSNALKAFLPGISSFNSIEGNHSLALKPSSTFGRHPWHPDPARRFNPVALDMMEAWKMIAGSRPCFVLGSITTENGVLWAGAGEMQEVVCEGIKRVDAFASCHREPRSRVIVAPGSDPQDETLYNAQRGLELAKNCIRESGEVLLLAACRKGVATTHEARENFYDRLTAPIPEVLAGLKENYVLYSHKAYKFARLLQKLKAVYLHSELDPETVRAAHLSPVQDPQKVVDRWQEESDEPILVVKDANKVALYPKPESERNVPQ
ncbi:MAG: lactate racemase domain-containing protein [Candidatus Brocadiia bacterium]